MASVTCFCLPDGIERSLVSYQPRDCAVSVNVYFDKEEI
jgi:hypothetical protein